MLSASVTVKSIALQQEALIALPALMGMSFDALGTGKQIRQGPDKVQGRSTSSPRERQQQEEVIGRVEADCQSGMVHAQASGTSLCSLNASCW